MMLPCPDDLIETFALLGDWEARYAYLIDLGRSLPQMDDSLKNDAILVKGCTSRVWLLGTRQGQIYHFTVDSDAAIVKGLCAVLLVFVQDQSGDAIHALDFEVIFTRLGLAAHLTPNRRNGFFAMVERVRKIAI